MLGLVVEGVLPSAGWRAVTAVHPYTVTGQQLDDLVDAGWLDLAECGFASPDLLASSGLDTHRWSGLALGLRGIGHSCWAKASTTSVFCAPPIPASEPR